MVETERPAQHTLHDLSLRMGHAVMFLTSSRTLAVHDFFIKADWVRSRQAAKVGDGNPILGPTSLTMHAASSLLILREQYPLAACHRHDLLACSAHKRAEQAHQEQQWKRRDARLQSVTSRRHPVISLICEHGIHCSGLREIAFFLDPFAGRSISCSCRWKEKRGRSINWQQGEVSRRQVQRP